jgi:hypothetical protein
VSEARKLLQDLGVFVSLILSGTVRYFESVRVSSIPCAAWVVEEAFCLFVFLWNPHSRRMRKYCASLREVSQIFKVELRIHYVALKPFLSMVVTRSAMGRFCSM